MANDNWLDKILNEKNMGTFRAYDSLNMGRINTQITNDVEKLKQQILDHISKNYVEKKTVENGDASDGYHTHNELYEFRRKYNIALFNEWAAQSRYNVLKSKVHHDGEEPFDGGWFIVQATLPDGQISNHYELKYWNDFEVPEKLPAKFDGHTAMDVLDRLQKLPTPTPSVTKQECEKRVLVGKKEIVSHLMHRLRYNKYATGYIAETLKDEYLTIEQQLKELEES